MRIPVFIEPVKDNGFRARGLNPDDVVGEGKTDTEALLNLRKAIENRIRAGAKLTYLEVAAEVASLEPTAGIFQPNDPLVQEWKEIMAENRRLEDEAPDVS
jgi:predicted RNase H-like HicB family nuclease